MLRHACQCQSKKVPLSKYVSPSCGLSPCGPCPGCQASNLLRDSAMGAGPSCYQPPLEVVCKREIRWSLLHSILSHVKKSFDYQPHSFPTQRPGSPVAIRRCSSSAITHCRCRHFADLFHPGSPSWQAPRLVSHAFCFYVLRLGTADRFTLVSASSPRHELHHVGSNEPPFKGDFDATAPLAQTQNWGTSF